MKKIFSAIAIVFSLTSCEDVIKVEVSDGTIQLVVDAFVNNLDEPQVIKLKNTKQFFDEVSQEAFIGASVYLKDDLNNMYLFQDVLNDGNYTWDDSVLVHEGRTYNLMIKANGVEYSSIDVANPVPAIDSLNWEYSPKTIGAKNGGYLVELVARDLIGQADYYWIRFKKNGVYDTRRAGLNLPVDGSFSEESMADGQLFIPPISTFPMFNVDDSLGLKDTAIYEIWSISEETNGFWAEVLNQAIDGGIGALFATPTSNVKTNISTSATQLKDQAVGWFSTSVVSSDTIIIIEKEGEKLSFPLF
jgi:hypothetical protein|tara:strand:+ start:793 stop:1701 length:909 start_codon:yes stop_codon:yes gene_type:complete